MTSAAVLTPSPPSILGGVVPHPGLAPTSITDLTINGHTGWMSNLGDALIDASVDFKIDGTSTLQVVVEDDHRTLLRSPLAQAKAYVNVDGVTFVLSGIRKQGPQLILLFDHEVVAALNDLTAPLVVATNTTTRTAFCRRLASKVPWIVVSAPDGESPGNVQSQLTVGYVDPATGLPLVPTIATVTAIKESYYDAMGRVLDEIGWRRFPIGFNQLILAPDIWLFNQDPVYVIGEDSPGVDSIDFNYDVRQPIATATITCRAEAWAFPVGTVVRLLNVGVSSGNFLVTEISRSLLSASCTVSLSQPLPTLPEPVGAAANLVRQAAAYSSVVAYAQSQLGVPYAWGEEKEGVGFDCSGLTQAAYASVGVTIPRVAQDQFNAGPPATNPIQAGDLVFFGSSPTSIEHVGINIGGGQMIDAPHSGAVVRKESFSALVGAPWDAADGLFYQGATRPVIPAPAAAQTAVDPSSGAPPSPTSSDGVQNQAIGQNLCAQVGWTGSAWVAFNSIVMAESGWITNARSGEDPGPPDGKAYGIPQSLPPDKMASSGADWETNPSTQISWMIGYIQQRYGDPQTAWNFHLAHGWY